MAAVSGPPVTGTKVVSRLGMMQAKLQEQLMVEKESRLLEMAARQEAERDNTIQRVTKSSASSLSSSLSSLSLGASLSGQGRVRKLFEDRRSTGYDKSYPLHPVKSGKMTSGVGLAKPQGVRGIVKSGSRGLSSDRGGGGSYGGGYGQSQQRSRSQVPPNYRNNGPSKPNNNLNNTRQNSNTQRLGHHKSNPSLLDASNNNTRTTTYGRRVNSSSETTPNSTPSPLNGSRYNSEAPPARRQLAKAPSPAPAYKSKPSPAPSPRHAPVKTAPLMAKAPRSLAPSPIVRRAPTAPSMPATPRKVPTGMSQCPICERCFNPDRIDKHKTICAKSKAKAKKRKVFDPIKMRNKGTEAEKYVSRGLHLKEVKTKKKDWRKQHQDFIATVRAAKGIKGYEAPPMDTSDYIECPHCGRKFNQMAGERHIPKCADIKSNKPAMGRRK